MYENVRRLCQSVQSTPLAPAYRGEEPIPRIVGDGMTDGELPLELPVRACQYAQYNGTGQGDGMLCPSSVLASVPPQSDVQYTGNPRYGRSTTAEPVPNSVTHVGRASDSRENIMCRAASTPARSLPPMPLGATQPPTHATSTFSAHEDPWRPEGCDKNGKDVALETAAASSGQLEPGERVFYRVKTQSSYREQRLRCERSPYTLTLIFRRYMNCDHAATKQFVERLADWLFPELYPPAFPLRMREVNSNYAFDARVDVERHPSHGEALDGSASLHFMKGEVHALASRR